MEIVTHVLTSAQQLDETRQKIARNNIKAVSGAKVKGEVDPLPVDENGIIEIPSGTVVGEGVLSITDGNEVLGQFGANQATPTTIDIGGKADKVSGVTSGHFAGLDVNGNLTDSGSEAADFATAAQGAKADTALQAEDIEGKEDKSNKVDTWSGTPDDEHYPTEKLVKDSLDQIDTDLADKADKVKNATEGNFAGLNTNGNLTDSGKGPDDFIESVTESTSNGYVKVIKAGIATDVPVYEHPNHSEHASGLYKITVDGEGHVSAVEQVAGKDILDILPVDSTYFAKTNDQLNLVVTKSGAYIATIGGASLQAVVDSHGDNIFESLEALRALLNGHAAFVADESDLPATGDSSKVYYVGPKGTGDDKYDVFVWKASESKYIKVDEASIDLSGYVLKVANPTAGHLASLTADGGIDDSGYSASDMVHGVILNGTELQKDANHKVSIDFETVLPPVGDNEDMILAGEGNETPTVSWKKLKKDYVGDRVEDGDGNPVLDENNQPVVDENSEMLWVSYKDVEFGARRAYEDHTGENIHDAIVKVNSINPSDSDPVMDGVASAGVSNEYSRADHVHPKDTTKADKVSGATNGNFAGLDSNGNLKDSGSAAADFATAAQGEKADTALQGFKINQVSLTPDANKVVTLTVAESSTNGNITIAGDEYTVYEHPTTGASSESPYPQFDRNMWKVALDDKGHVFVTGSKSPVAVTDTDIANLGVFDSAHPYVSSNNKGATVAHVTDAVADAIAALDSEATSADGANVQVKVTQVDGEISAVSVTTDNTVNATYVNNAITTAIASKADKVASATAGNFAGLDANGNLTDSGSKAADFATKVANATAGNFAGLDANGNVTDSGSKASDFKTKQAAVANPTASGSGIEFIDSISQDTNGVIVPTKKSVQAVVASTAGVGGNAGVMSAADKEKLDGITNYIESASVTDRTLTLTPKTGNPVQFTDTGDANIIEHITVNSVEVQPVNKTVDITVPTVNDAHLSIKLGSAAAADTGFSANSANAVTVEIPNATTGSTGVDGLMSNADKTKLDGIEAGAEVNTVESISLGNGSQILPTTGTTNIQIPMAGYDDAPGGTTYTNGAMSGRHAEIIDKLKNFSTVALSDGTTTVGSCMPDDTSDTLTIVAGQNITLTKTSGANEFTIAAAGGTTVSAGRSVSIVETPTATGTDYEVSVDGAVGYYGSEQSIANVTASPLDLLSASSIPSINSGNDRFIVEEDQTTGYVYLYALQTVHDALDPSNDVEGVDIFTLSYNVQVERTPAYGFYGVAGVQLVRKSTSAPVLHSSTESYPSTVGQCSVNGTTTVWNNAGTPTTIGGKVYYGYRLLYVGDVSQGSGDTLGITARFSVVENMSGTAEYTGTVSSYTAGKGIEIDQSNEINAKLGDGLKFNATDNSIEVNLKTGGGLQFESDGSVLAISLDQVTEEVVDTVQEISSDMDAKLTTNFPYPMITDVSYDFGSLNVGGTCVCQLFSVPFRHPVRVDETYFMVYAKDTGYSQSPVMFGIYEYNPAGNNGTGQTNFICDTGAVSIAKATTKDVLEFPVKHVNADADYRALRPDRMYYAVLAMPSSAGSGIFLASAPNYNAPVNSQPTLNWRMDNCNLIDWSVPADATLDESMVHWWDSGYNEHNSMNRFFMQIRNHVTQNNGN